MRKILLIAQREFLARVQKKTFLVTTILLPVLIMGLYALIFYFTVQNDDRVTIAITDRAAFFKGPLNNAENIRFRNLPNASQAELESLVKNKSIDGYLYIPAVTLPTDKVDIVSDKSLGLKTQQVISNVLNDSLKTQRLRSLNITPELMNRVSQALQIRYTTIGSKDDNALKTGIGYGVGFVSGFLIYFILLLYGMAVMRGVMEEKVSRIAEVLVSSVKPFQLMMGKITGIGAVGLCQFLIWIVLTVVLRMLLLPLLFPQVSSALGGQAAGASPAGDDTLQTILQGLGTVNFPLIIGCFILYFLGGYLLYASLFAAIGSAVNEDPQDAQSFTLPVTLPIVFGFIIMMQTVNNPHSPLSVFGSLFPLTSPIVMMARVAQGVPDAVTYWELALSILLLIGGFLFTTWLAGRIYRTGILMYGKKPSWAELFKWAFNKQ